MTGFTVISNHQATGLEMICLHVSERYVDWSVRKIESTSHVVLGGSLQVSVDWDWITTGPQLLFRITGAPTGITATLKDDIGDDMGKIHWLSPKFFSFF